MDVDGQQMVIEEGTDVYGSDGEKVGSVVAVQPHYLVVEKGFFFPTDYYIPRSALTSYDDGKVFLNVSKDDALNQGWDQAPVDEETVVTSSSTTQDDVLLQDETLRRDASLGSAGSAAPGTTATGWRDTDTSREVTETDTLRVPVREETLSATTREQEIGQVEIAKEVVSEEQTLQVPVREERVRVERHAVDRAADATEAGAFEEQVIAVPLRGETVETHKEVRVSEELAIDKEAVERTEAVSDTVRREEVQVRERVSGEPGRGQRTGRGDTTDTTDTTGLLPEDDASRRS